MLFGQATLRPNPLRGLAAILLPWPHHLHPPLRNHDAGQPARPGVGLQTGDQHSAEDALPADHDRLQVWLHHRWWRWHRIDRDQRDDNALVQFNGFLLTDERSYLYKGKTGGILNVRLARVVCSTSFARKQQQLKPCNVT